ncbi:sigma-70 family RNA polymerase sigma factor [Vagococcus sp.]|uniref:sigma-70 family RNA polymerase sigma factor n=1 Tax=Vagococcus sp. TaxID=1933889 RepID=UPI003F9DE6EE
MITEEELLDNYHNILLGALKKCHIYFYHPQFEDYLQLARWTLIETYREQLKNGVDLTNFNNFIYQKVYWKIIDAIRHDLKQQKNEFPVEPVILTETKISTTIDETEILVEERLTKLLPHLTPREKDFLFETLINGLSISEIAKKYQVSRQVVYRWRDHTALKYLKYLA